jgi:phenazine biosynthesis protein phzE
MLGHQLSALGLDVTIRPFDASHPIDDYDLIVVGPGPGDPRMADDPKITTMRRVIRRVLDESRPLLVVCLGHQVLSHLLGLELRRLPVPNQGAQHEVEVFGRQELCGFYNTFAAYADADQVAAPVRGGKVELARDQVTGAVHATRGERFRSLQFHAESVLTQRGIDLIGWMVTELLPDAPTPEASSADGLSRPTGRPTSRGEGVSGDQRQHSDPSEQAPDNAGRV